MALIRGLNLFALEFSLCKRHQVTPHSACFRALPWAGEAITNHLEKVGFCLFVSSPCWGPVHHSPAAPTAGCVCGVGGGLLSVWCGAVTTHLHFFGCHFCPFQDKSSCLSAWSPAAFFSVQTVLAAHGIWGAPSPIAQDYDQVCNRSSLSAFLDGPEVKNFG